MSAICGSTLEERGENMLMTGIASDCTFLVGDDKKKIKASKVFLIRASAVFERMFCGEFPITDPIEVPDIEPSVFEVMLRFIYGCKWAFENNEQAIKLCYAADKYMIREILDRCEEYLWPNGPENVWSALEVANLYSLEKLRHAAFQIIENVTFDDFMYVIESPDIINVSQACIASVVKSKALKFFNELLVFKMCLRWATAKCEEKGLAVDGPHLRSELGETLYHIRFLVMTAEDFVNEVVRTAILTSEESLHILCYLVTRGRSHMSNRLCPTTTARYDD